MRMGVGSICAPRTKQGIIVLLKKGIPKVYVYILLLRKNKGGPDPTIHTNIVQ